MNVETSNMVVNAGSIRGRYKIQVMEEGVGEVESYDFKNMITEYGLNNIFAPGQGNSGCNCCQLGSGTTPPVASSLFTGATSDTVLGGFLVAAWQPNYPQIAASSISPYATTFTCTYVFPYGFTGVNGMNFSEIGISQFNTSGSNLFSRALIKDSNGNPTTISATNTTQLVVVYILEFFPNLTTQTFTGVVAGVNYTVLAKACNVTQAAPYYPYLCGPTTNNVTATFYSGGIGALTSAPSGNTIGVNTFSISPYANNSLQCSTVFGFNQGNFLPGNAPITAAAIQFGQGPIGRWQFSFADVNGNGIPKTNSNTLSLTFTFQWGVYQ